MEIIGPRLFSVIILSVCVSIGACSKNPQSSGEDKSLIATNHVLVDTLATAETIALFQNLRSVSQNHVLFGHQDDLAYGVGWWAFTGRSDVKEVCGDYPAVIGWDLGDIHRSENLDGVSFARMKTWIQDVYERGGINTISMHLDNPVTSGSAWDNSPAVAAVLPGGTHHSVFLNTLDLIAGFLKSLKSNGGIMIPVILRPYHEHNHSWAWWGSGSCNAEEYNSLWRMTVEYLRDTHEIHHLLYCISPQEIRSEAEYLTRYPGDAYVDILGLDDYSLRVPSDISGIGTALKIVAGLAKNRNKVSALTETGVENLPYTNWWTDCLLASIKQNTQSRDIAWVLVWRNASADHFFAPYSGHPGADNFVEFYNDPISLFESDLPDMYH